MENKVCMTLSVKEKEKNEFHRTLLVKEKENEFYLTLSVKEKEKWVLSNFVVEKEENNLFDLVSEREGKQGERKRKNEFCQTVPVKEKWVLSDLVGDWEGKWGQYLFVKDKENWDL